MMQIHLVLKIHGKKTVSNQISGESPNEILHHLKFKNVNKLTNGHRNISSLRISLVISLIL